MSRVAQVAFLLLAGALAACQAGVPSGAPTRSPSPTSGAPTAPPTAAPSAPTSFEATFSCPPPSLTLVPPSNRLTGVEVSSRAGFDQVIFRFGPPAEAGGSAPVLAVAPTGPPFVEGASGRPLAVAGERFIALTFRQMVIADGQGNPSDAGPGRLTGPGPAVREVVRSEAFEGVVSWLIGTATPGCARVAVDRAAERLLVEVAHP